MNSAPRLYAITDTHLLPGKRLGEAVTEALAGGCEWVQYRDKSTDQKRRRREAELLLELCHAYGAKLLINDDMWLARAVGADGVHLGQGDGNPAAARKLLGPNALIGVTCHDSLALANAAREAGADYIAFGRFFPSATKPDAPPAPLSLLTQAQAEFPHSTRVAIGGITLDNAAQVLAAGATTLAVSHSLFTATDIRACAQRFVELTSNH